MQASAPAPSPSAPAPAAPAAPAPAPAPAPARRPHGYHPVLMTTLTELAFPAMGTSVRLLGAPGARSRRLAP